MFDLKTADLTIHSLMVKHSCRIDKNVRFSPSTDKISKCIFNVVTMYGNPHLYPLSP